MICYFKTKLCSVSRKFHCAASSASEPKSKPVRATLGRTQTRFSSLPMHRRARLFVYFMPYLANKPPKHRSGSRICVLPRSTESSEKVSRGCAAYSIWASLQQSEGQQFSRPAWKGPFPNTRLFSWVPWIKKCRSQHGSERLLSFYWWCNAAGIYQLFYFF